MTYVVASLVERSIAGVSDSSKKAFRLGADLVEVRLDRLTSAKLTPGTIQRVRGAIRGPAIATLRSAAEGGGSSIKGAARTEALREVLGAGFEFVDLELRTDRRLLAAGVPGSGRPKVIVSSHFRKPVDRATLSDRLTEACEAGDIGKVAMPCEDAGQAIGLAETGLAFSRRGEQFTLIGMGEQGQLTRACARKIGSSMAYACLPGREAAPGQLDVQAQCAMLGGDRLLLGLVGHPVSHSVSKPMQEAAMTKEGIPGRYLHLDIPPEGFDRNAVAVLRRLGFDGLNITIPHKTKAFELCDEHAPSAAATGAVNTLSFRGGSVCGENTDSFGFSKLIEGKIRIGKHRSALVIGAGGAARAAAHVLSRSGIDVSIAARHLGKAEEVASMTGTRAVAFASLGKDGPGYDIVVNCTPIGMKGFKAGTVPARAFGRGTVFFDMVYNPPVTATMRTARSKGARAYGGLDMLVNQGAEAFRIWTGRRPDVAAMRRAARRALA